MLEVWKDIDGYEGLYQVSNFGNVRSVDRYVHIKSGVRVAKGKTLKPIEDKSGYLQVSLSKHDKRKTYLIHRLVANTFLSNPLNYPCINHIDENKKNNRVYNLEFCSIQYNNNFNGGMYKRAEKRKKSIRQIKNGDVVAVWDSALSASLHLHISRGNIVGCLKGHRKTAGGYCWEYE